MQDLILYIVLILLILVIYLLLSQTKNRDQKKNNEELDRLKNSLNNSINTMSTSFNSLSKDVTRDMTQALTKVDEKVAVFNQQAEALNKGQQNFSRILAGVKQYGVLAEFSLASLLKDLLPASQYITNVKIKPEETSENVEFAVKLQDEVLCPIDSYWPIEKFKAIDDAYQNKNKQMLSDAKKVLASAFRDKAKKVVQKYISQPKTTDFAIIYAPTEGLFSELASYRDPNTKELLTQELIKKYKITIMGPNTLSAFLQALHMGFQTLKVQKHATQIHDDLKMITTRFGRHFDGIKELRKKLEDAIGVTDNFGRNARSIMRTLENIKDPEEVEKAIKEDIDKVKVLNK